MVRVKSQGQLVLSESKRVPTGNIIPEREKKKRKIDRKKEMHHVIQ